MLIFNAEQGHTGKFSIIENNEAIDYSYRSETTCESPFILIESSDSTYVFVWEPREVFYGQKRFLNFYDKDGDFIIQFQPQ